MEKQTQIPYLLLGLAIITILFHNYVSAVLGIEETVFFVISLLLLLAFAVSVVFNVYTYIQEGKPKDIWKMGWLGLLGLLGLFTGPGMYGFYGFFGFFGLRKSK